MKQLGILDAAFINLEQTNTPQHVGGLGIYDPSTAPDGFVRFKQVISSFERRLNKNPLFRTRLVEVPGGLDRPYWVKDANFDVEFHLRHIALPEPGDWRQLCIQVARLHARPLDLSRPLWEAYIIEGLDNIPNLPKGCFAVYTKMHHALVDGAGGQSFMALLHDLTPNPQEETPDNEPRLVDTQPSTAELLSKATVNGVKNGFSLARGTLRNVGALGKYLLDIARDEIPAPDVTAPKTIFNKPVGPHRVFDAAEFPLQGFKDIKDAAGVTINDVALTVVSGALRRYMDARGEKVEGSLAAGIPLNMRTRRGETDANNQVGSAYCSLHTDIDDPLERLMAVQESADIAKKDGEVSPLVDVLQLAGAFSPVVAKTVAGVWSRNQLGRFIPLNISTVITNVPGPNFPLYCAGAKLVDYYAAGVLTPGMGIFHAVFSYAGKITLSVLADRDIMPDPEFYHDCLVSSYEELSEAAASIGKPKGKKGAKTRVDKTRRKRVAPAKATRTKAAGKSGSKAKAKAKARTSATTRAKSGVKKKAPVTKKAGATKKKSPARPRVKRRPDLKVVPKLQGDAPKAKAS